MGSGIIDGSANKAGNGQVGQQHTEGDGDQQQGLKALADTHVQQDTGNDEHDHGLPVQSGKAGTPSNLAKRLLLQKFHTLPLLSTDGDQQVIGVHSSTHNGRDGLHSSVHGSGDLDFHLHGLQHHQHIAGLHSLAHRALHLKDVAGHGAVHGRLTGSHSGRSRSRGQAQAGAAGAGAGAAAGAATGAAAKERRQEPHSCW